jgi:hypothetical protein
VTGTLGSVRLDGPDDPFEFFGDLHAKGLTDGLPVVPPLERYVRAMVEHSGLRAGEVIADIPPEGGPATVEKLAVNAVMAGCLPEYFPVVIAAIRALAQPRYNLLGVQTTTNPVTPVIVVNGPIRGRIGLHAGRGCMGPGFRANATIGRAVKLALLNIGGCPPGDVSKAIHGYPGRYSFCFGELEEESPWDPFHVDLGYRREQSTVTVFGGQGTQNIYACYLKPESVVHMLANGMAVYGNNGYLRGTGNPVVVFSPGHAKLFAAHGWDKARIRRELFERTLVPLSQLPEEKQLSHPIYNDWDRSRSIRLCGKPEDIAILVAGGPEAYHITYIPSFSTTEMVTQAIE